MSRKQLSPFDKGQIVVYHENGMSYREIARKFERSHSTIMAICKKYENYLFVFWVLVNLCFCLFLF